LAKQKFAILGLITEYRFFFTRKNAFVEVHMMQKLNYIRCGDYYIPDIRLPEEAAMTDEQKNCLRNAQIVCENIKQLQTT